MSINGIVVNIDPFGVTVQGTLAGTTRPFIDVITIDNNLRLYAKKIFLPGIIDITGTDLFEMPVAFGKGMCFLFVNGVCYKLGLDYTIEGNRVKWLNPGISLYPADDIIAWGPANDYTAAAIGFEVFDLTNNSVYTSGSGTVKLKPRLVSEQYPKGEQTIYLFKNGELLTPGISFDFTYNSSTKEITSGLLVNLVPSANYVFAFYVNSVATLPFSLGDTFYRTNLTYSGSLSLNLTANPEKLLVNAANVFYDRKRYIQNEDFSIRFPILNVLPGESLNDDLINGTTLDVSYFKNNFIPDTISSWNEERTSGFGGVIADTVVTTYTPTSFIPTLSKQFLFFNGLLTVGKNFDRIEGSTSGDLVFGSFPSGVGLTPGHQREWERIGANVTFYTRARYPLPGDALIPTVYTGPLAGIDNLLYTAFTDASTISGISTEYFYRKTTRNSTSVQLSTPIRQKKFIQFYNGLAYFPQHFGGEIQILNPGSGDNQLNYDLSLPALDGTDPLKPFDDIIVWSWVEDSFASLWQFEKIVLTSNITFDGSSGATIETLFAISSLGNSFVFYNGLRVEPSKMTLDPLNNKKIRLNFSLMDRNAVIGDVFWVIHP